MKNGVKKALLFGVGAFHMTRDKIEDFIQELHQEGYLDKEEGQKMVRETMSKVEEYKKKTEGDVRKAVKMVMKELKRESKSGKVNEDDVVKKVMEKLDKPKTKKAKVKPRAKKSSVKKKK